MTGRAVTAVGRMTLTPLLVRLAVGLLGLAALLLAAPAPLLAWPPTLVGLAALAAGPAVAPAGRWPTLLVLAAAAGWLLQGEAGLAGAVGTPGAVGTAGAAGPAGAAGSAIALGGLLYLLHTLAALAAGLPHDVVVAPEMLAGWLGRALLVTAAAAGLAGVVLVGLPWLAALAGGGDRGHAGFTLAGLALAVGTAAVLRGLLRRPAIAPGSVEPVGGDSPR